MSSISSISSISSLQPLLSLHSIPPTKEESYKEIFTKGISIRPVIVWFEVDEIGTQQNIIDCHAQHIEPSFDEILLKAFVYESKLGREIEWKCPIKEAKYGVVFSNKDDRKETYELTHVARRHLRDLTSSYGNIWKDIEDLRQETIRNTLKETIDKVYPNFERYSYVDNYSLKNSVEVYTRTFQSFISIEASLNDRLNEQINIVWIWKGEKYTSLQRVMYEIQTNMELVRLMLD
jgi:hypothetical protein